MQEIEKKEKDAEVIADNVRKSKTEWELTLDEMKITMEEKAQKGRRKAGGPQMMKLANSKARRPSSDKTLKGKDEQCTCCCFSGANLRKERSMTESLVQRIRCA